MSQLNPGAMRPSSGTGFMEPRGNEEFVYRAVQNGDLRIDADGSVWRVSCRRGIKGSAEARSVPCSPRRAEHMTPSGYLTVPAMVAGSRRQALAHRLVWRHLYGPIPDGLTINHKNGQKDDNSPSNLELATASQQMRHAVNHLAYNPTTNLPPSGTKASESTRRTLSDVVRKRWADGVYANWPSQSTRKKMSDSAKRRRRSAA